MDRVRGAKQSFDLHALRARRWARPRLRAARAGRFGEPVPGLRRCAGSEPMAAFTVLGRGRASARDPGPPRSAAGRARGASPMEVLPGEDRAGVREIEAHEMAPRAQVRRQAGSRLEASLRRDVMIEHDELRRALARAPLSGSLSAAMSTNTTSDVFVAVGLAACRRGRGARRTRGRPRRATPPRRRRSRRDSPHDRSRLVAPCDRSSASAKRARPRGGAPPAQPACAAYGNLSFGREMNSSMARRAVSGISRRERVARAGKDAQLVVGQQLVQAAPRPRPCSRRCPDRPRAGASAAWICGRDGEQAALHLVGGDAPSTCARSRGSSPRRSRRRCSRGRASRPGKSSRVPEARLDPHRRPEERAPAEGAHRRARAAAARSQALPGAHATSRGKRSGKRWPRRSTRLPPRLPPTRIACPTPSASRKRDQRVLVEGERVARDPACRSSRCPGKSRTSTRWSPRRAAHEPSYSSMREVWPGMSTSVRGRPAAAVGPTSM